MKLSKSDMMRVGKIAALLLLTEVSCNIQKNENHEIIACGGRRIIIFDEEQSDGDNLKIIWQWNISEASRLPADYQKYLNPLDDCKPVDGSRKVLATSSGGGVVLIDRESKDILFYANAPMAHSAECLPGDRIVVALSDHPYGNRIELYDIVNPEKCICHDTLTWGHGVVWISKSERLYALGSNDLVCYSLMNWDSEQPELKREKTWKLPAWGGHDLISISDNELIVSVAETVFRFYIDSEKFELFELLDGEDIKSVNYNKETGKLVYTQAEIDYWTHHIYSKNPDKTYTIPDVEIYKARVYPK